METRIYTDFEDKLNKINEDIKNGIQVELRTQQKQIREKTIHELKQKEQIVLAWEKSYNKTFNGSAVDIIDYNELLSVCAELEISIFKAIEDIYLPVNFRLDKQNDLKYYYYLPRSLIE